MKEKAQRWKTKKRQEVQCDHDVTSDVLIETGHDDDWPVIDVVKKERTNDDDHEERISVNVAEQMQLRQRQRLPSHKQMMDLMNRGDRESQIIL